MRSAEDLTLQICTVADNGTVHDMQLHSGYGRCVLLDVYRTVANNHDNNQPVQKELPSLGSRPKSIISFQDLFAYQCLHLVRFPERSFFK